MTETHSDCQRLLVLHLHSIGLWVSPSTAAYEQHKASEMRFWKGAKANNGHKWGKRRKENTKNIKGVERKCAKNIQ